jgi:hypothetical protein
VGLEAGLAQAVDWWRHPIDEQDGSARSVGVSVRARRSAE